MFEDLPTFDLQHIQPFFPEGTAQEFSAAAELKGELRLARRTEKRRLLNLLRVANAAKMLDTLPVPGESIHCVMKGNTSGWDLVPAILQLAAPATIARLDLATLGFSTSNIEQLAALTDAGKIGPTRLVCSCYFKGNSGDEFEFARLQLSARGGTIVAVRSHAKLLLLEMSDGRCFTVESSANLRSCHNAEQFSLHIGRDLLDFHRAWLTELIEASRAKPTATAPPVAAGRQAAGRTPTRPQNPETQTNGQARPKTQAHQPKETGRQPRKKTAGRRRADG